MPTEPVPVLPTREEALTYALLADSAYYPPNNIAEWPTATPPQTPDDYKLLLDCPEDLQWWGYFGKAFYKVNEETKKIEFVVAHRGTANTFDVIEDLELWLEKILPAQYAKAALPFMRLALQKFKAEVLPKYTGYEVAYKAVGHSLGAGLAEATIIDSCAQIHDLPPMKGVLFENSGIPVNPERLPKNYSESVVEINTYPDCVNTYKPSYTSNKAHLAIDNRKYPRLLGLPLPIPNKIEYFAYSEICHEIENTITYLRQPEAKLGPVNHWPYGFDHGYYNWLSFPLNQAYWNGYMQDMWNNCGLASDVLKICFYDDYAAFTDFFQTYFLINESMQNDLNAGLIENLDFLLEVKAAEGVRILQNNSVMWNVILEKEKKEKRQIFQNKDHFLDCVNKIFPVKEIKKYPLLENFQTKVTAHIHKLIQKYDDDDFNPCVQNMFKAFVELNAKLSKGRQGKCRIDESTYIGQAIKAICTKYHFSFNQIAYFSEDYKTEKVIEKPQVVRVQPQVDHVNIYYPKVPNHQLFSAMPTADPIKPALVKTPPRKPSELRQVLNYFSNGGATTHCEAPIEAIHEDRVNVVPPQVKASKPNNDNREVAAYRLTLNNFIQDCIYDYAKDITKLNNGILNPANFKKQQLTQRKIQELNDCLARLANVKSASVNSLKSEALKVRQILAKHRGRSLSALFSLETQGVTKFNKYFDHTGNLKMVYAVNESQKLSAK